MKMQTESELKRISIYCYEPYFMAVDLTNSKQHYELYYKLKNPMYTGWGFLKSLFAGIEGEHYNFFLTDDEVKSLHHLIHNKMNEPNLSAKDYKALLCLEADISSSLKFEENSLCRKK